LIKKLRLKPSDFFQAFLPFRQFFQMALASEKNPPNETDALASGRNEIDASASGPKKPRVKTQGSFDG